MDSSDSNADPMQLDTTAKIQLSVDRARSQAHRPMHKCTAELRKLQTERIYRNESTDAGTDLSHMSKPREMAQLDAILDAPMPSGSFCKTDFEAAYTA